jgi:predicted aminopeptidase
VKALPILLSFFLLSGCSSLGYLVENGVGQWRLFNRARPVEEVLASPYTSEATRRAIRLVGEAKEFAVAELGLRATGNYSSFVPLDEPCVVWAVSAADPLKLEERKWRFPIVGEVPYLGFFKKGSAEAEAVRLQASATPSLDTWVRCVPAFSSLGWFSDPLYSSMLRGEDRDIAELVVHESLHATVWVGNSVDFNEKLANFVGLEGSLRFVEKMRGEVALALAKKQVLGEKLFGDFLHETEARYRATVATAEDKRRFYEELPRAYAEFLTARKARGTDFVPLKAKLEGWNNAAFLAYLNYYSDYSIFEALLRKCDGDLRRFVRWIVAEQEKGTERFESAPEDHLAELVKESSCVP